ncbi:endonuclease domain-containing protein [Caedibacter taeniospiralis]|uniref:endonuclease domain-containing protein n=1 Tax=Caedibacter taeniospiralis TaxID=28907 RepID=UPI001E55C303|nr:DUF559 domain-containing protein [Caedibacter taeniospiralis]
MSRIIKPLKFMYPWARLPHNAKLKQFARELRKAGNLSEVLLWQQLKSRKLLNLKFDRQTIIGNYIVDFYCYELGVVIEIDGCTHDFKTVYDTRRDGYLQQHGLMVIHLLDRDVKQSLSAAVAYLEGVLMKRQKWLREYGGCYL